MAEDLGKIRCCVDKIIPLALDPQAEEVAINENPKNVPGSGSAENERMALMTRKMWKNGRTIRVCFLDGNAAMREKVKTYAKVWPEHANITFEFVDDADAEIRISFQADPGSWSALGTDAIVAEWYPPGVATMNFGWLTPDTDDEEYSRVVTHEFGHALGCIHEHQGPAADIKWNKPVVYRYFIETHGWSREDVDHNLFDRYSEEVTQFTRFDPHSIMIYDIPQAFTLDGKSFPRNSKLSQADIDFIRKQYPRS
jgi:serralysin